MWGALVGDALGVPVEFKSKKEVRKMNITSMVGWGTHNQPPGTWSDDGSLLLCTAESILECAGIDTKNMTAKFVQWRTQNLWTATGRVFDIGNATNYALTRCMVGIPPEEAGGCGEHENGNGSLMRILPVIPAGYNTHVLNQVIDDIHRVSSITHRHIHSKMSCEFFAHFVRGLYQFGDAAHAHWMARKNFVDKYDGNPDMKLFEKLLYENFIGIPDEQICGDGYVLNTLIASIWCLRTTDNFRDCVLKAVNLGDDTDTTACVAGALAGTLYGRKGIPKEWIDTLPMQTGLNRLIDHFVSFCCLSGKIQ